MQSRSQVLYFYRMKRGGEEIWEKEVLLCRGRRDMRS